ncbi:MAG: hypothetical protein JO243_03450 [Solirubrobacterales bacterium]|nr:hypothetical protein [Solirubrobacterales bacterium]
MRPRKPTGGPLSARSGVGGGLGLAERMAAAGGRDFARSGDAGLDVEVLVAGPEWAARPARSTVPRNVKWLVTRGGVTTLAAATAVPAATAPKAQADVTATIEHNVRDLTRAGILTLPAEALPKSRHCAHPIRNARPAPRSIKPASRGLAEHSPERSPADQPTRPPTQRRKTPVKPTNSGTLLREGDK